VLFIILLCKIYYNSLSVEGDTGLGVEGRRGGRAEEVSGDDLVLGVVEDTLEVL
jgi:hypothetical protein